MRQAELAALVREALAVLNEDQKLAVLLNKFEEMSYAEIADVMGRSPAAVKSLLGPGSKPAPRTARALPPDRSARHGGTGLTMISWRSLRLGDTCSQPIAARERQVVAGWLNGLGRRSTPWCFPGRARSAAWKGRADRFVHRAAESYWNDRH